MAAVELHKLNGDTSWLIRLPLKQQLESRSFYNIVLDPWLHPTPQVDGSPLFSRQTRIEPAAFGSLAQLDCWLRSLSSNEALDAVLFSHPFTDHLHPETVCDKDSLAVLRAVKAIFTTNDSLSALRALGVKGIPAASIVDITSTAYRQDGGDTDVLPTGIEIEHLPARDWAASPAWHKLHSGISSRVRMPRPNANLILSTRRHAQVDPSTHAVAIAGKMARILIHSFDRQTLPLIGTVACGFPNVLDLIPTFRPDAVLATHDEHKRAEGIVGHLIKRTTVSLDQAASRLDSNIPTYPASSSSSLQASASLYPRLPLLIPQLYRAR